eukprot:CAMPEP_0206144720 /NCGR_PEP_ID=MMETSP1473-20131121/25013_1 /ASSEMBLY_ACC=CAM_ASM_001109 /TAXON_ID=1461547 /ORGANISM="Stichococcus sp, Strain RCC1054" /LENGTH=328 /DNA_ID=CAMNT_0053540631 /DNA_START=406 /DNA_END=1388 /DNA_ORIENTATION=-
MLNVNFVARLHPDGELPEHITAVQAAERNLSSCDSLKPFKQLLRLDLGGNKFTELGGLTASTSLKWLSLAHNQLTALPPLDIPELQVLNIAGNKIRGTLRVKGVPKLRALIANDNELTTVKGLGRLPELNTLVVKSNSITDLGDSLRGCAALEKLSMAHNELSDLGDALTGLPQLQELRVGHNDLPGLPAALEDNARLKIVDVGGCPIRTIEAIQVLAKLPLLQQLGVRGCPLTAEGPNHPATLLEAFPLLETLDGKRVRARIRRRVGVPPGGTAAGAAAGAATAGGPAGARALGRQASVADNTGKKAGSLPSATASAITAGPPRPSG